MKINSYFRGEAFVHEDILKAKWMQAWQWCEWWMRLPHLKMLCQAFTGDQERAGAPRDTNGGKPGKQRQQHSWFTEGNGKLT